MLEQQERSRPRKGTQHLPQPGCDQAQSLTLCACREGAGMQHEPGQPQRLGACVLLFERGLRLRAQRRCGSGKVDEIAVVRHHRLDTALRDAAAEQDDLVGRQRPGAPLARGLGEDLQRFAAAGDSAIDGTRQATGDREMSPEAGHQSPNTSAAKR
jgi:hypothetical protein